LSGSKEKGDERGAKALGGRKVLKKGGSLRGGTYVLRTIQISGGFQRKEKSR